MKLINRRFLVYVAALLALLAAAAFGRSIALPPAVQVQVRMTSGLSSATAQPGTSFRGTLQAPIVVNGRVLYPRGSQVTGTVVACHRSGRLTDPGVLDLALTSVHNGSMWSRLHTQVVHLQGESHTKSNLEKIGGGAAAGTLLGALFGGGKGAVIGAAAGTAAGTGVAASTGRKDIRVAPEQVLAWVTTAPPAPANPAPPQQQYSAPPPQYEEYSAPPPPPPAPRYVRGRYDDDDNERDGDRDSRYHAIYGFSDRDREIIGACYSDDDSNLPPGLAKRDRLPPGLERQLQKNGALPPGLQKRVRALPTECERQLPPLPGGWARVVISGRVILLDPGNRIVDLFFLAGRD